MTLRQRLLGLSILIAIATALYVEVTFPLRSLQIIKLSQYSSLLSVVYLYLSLLISPLWIVLPRLPFKEKAITARRAFGLSGWGFGLLHGVVAFFGQLHGFSGLGFLSSEYVIALVYGSIALFLFSLMALTSSSKAVQYLGFSHWKLLHRFTYIASILVVIHTLTLGTHFNESSSFVPTLFYFLLLLLVLLELHRLWTCWRHAKSHTTHGGIRIAGACILVSLFGAIALQSGTNTLSVHPAHSTQHVDTHTQEFSPYTIAVSAPSPLPAGEPVSLGITIVDTKTVTPVQVSTHAIIVDDKLDWFAHQDATHMDVSFPHPGTYYVYAPFTAPGKAETMLRTAIEVTTYPQTSPPVPTAPPYQITMSPSLKMLATDFSSGKNPITFAIQNLKTHAPITTLDANPDHRTLVSIINRDTFAYIFVHMTESRSPDQIAFIPAAGHEIVPPGRYRIFAQFPLNGRFVVQSFYFQLE